MKLFGRAPVIAGAAQPGAAHMILQRRTASILNRAPREEETGGAAPFRLFHRAEGRSLAGLPETSSNIAMAPPAGSERLEGGAPPDGGGMAPPDGSAVGDGPTRTIYFSRDVWEQADSYSVIFQNTQVMNFLIEQAAFSSMDLPQDAFRAYCADFYLQQVLNGGHAQFMHNAFERENVWRGAREGLVAAGAEQHLAFFDGFLKLLAVDPIRAEAIRASSGFEPVDAEVKAMDAAFYRLEDQMPLAPILSGWLKSRPDVVVLERLDFDRLMTDLVESPQAADRVKTAQDQAMKERLKNPFERMGVEIARKAGLTFERWVMKMPTYTVAAEVYKDAVIMQTDNAVAVMVRSATGEYLLLDKETGRRLSTLGLHEDWTDDRDGLPD